MRPYQKAEYRVLFSLNLLNAVQNGVFTLGTLLLCYLNAFQISIDLQQVPMFVTLLTYLAQLQAPLNFFGSFYTQAQNNLVDAERMLELVRPFPGPFLLGTMMVDELTSAVVQRTTHGN